MISFSFLHAENLFKKSIRQAIGPEDLDTIIAWPMEKVSILFSVADQVYKTFFSNAVFPCSLLNIKCGGCSEDCAFCAQSAHNRTHVDVKNLVSNQEILDAYTRAQEKKLDFCVVSSGKRLHKTDIEKLAAALKACGGPVHASLGILDEEDFSLLREAGVVCYNHNLETSRAFFPRLVTTHSYDSRIATVVKAKEAGISVCSGGIFGVGESWQDRKQLCLELMHLDVDTVPINFYIPIPGTKINPPLERPLEFLKIVAMFRIAMPNKIIKVCGGREKHLGRLQPFLFIAGANGYISGGYLTTAGDGIESDDQLLELMDLRKRL